MTNLSTSEVFEILEKYAPESKKSAETDITPDILQRLAQTLLKLERAKEALRIFEIKNQNADPGFCHDCWSSPHEEAECGHCHYGGLAKLATETLAYIEEGKE